MPVLLFDIDGTLIRSGGAGKLAMEGALKQAFALTSIDYNVPYSGRTDVAIGRDLLRVHGIEPSDTNIRALHDEYLSRLPRCLTENPGTICPGVPELLKNLRNRSDTHIGLITGNIRPGAEAKLRHYGLWDYFPTGGFGDIHEDRNDVARSAVNAMRQHFGHELDTKEIWVIGDTPLDISCARAIGAKVIAVATGWHPKEELIACGADVVLDNLADHQAVYGFWF